MSDENRPIELEETERAKYIWIFRKWNGQAVVYPSPAVLKVGRPFRIVNKTKETANVVFPSGRIKLEKSSIPPDTWALAEANKPSGYFEYEVHFGGPEKYAEGGSKPGVIVEH